MSVWDEVLQVRSGVLGIPSGPPRTPGGEPWKQSAGAAVPAGLLDNWLPPFARASAVPHPCWPL